MTEKTAEVRRGRRVVRLTHLDRLWWPDEGIRKADVVAYYRAVAPVLLPHLRGRPFTIKQHYTGPRSPFRWVKDAPPEAPDWLAVASLPARSRGGALVRYPLVNDELALPLGRPVRRRRPARLDVTCGPARPGGRRPLRP